jgi:hypothetical protein
MLPLQTPDPTLTMLAGTVLNPTVLVRNTTPKVVPATLSITWHGEREAVDGAAKVQYAPRSPRDAPDSDWASPKATWHTGHRRVGAA